VFRSGETLNRVLKLEVHTSDKLVIDPDPYVVPLEAILERNEKVLFVESSKEESRFGLYQLGYCERIHRIQSFVPSDTVDKTKFGTAQRHRLTHLEWHLKHTADVAYRLHNQHSFDVMVVMAENRIEAMLEEYLHESLKERIIGRIHNSPDADGRDRKKLIESALRDYHAKKEAEAVEELSKYRPEEVVATLPEVIEACNLFVVRRLLVSEGLHRRGFMCKEHHYVSLDAGECPFDGATLLPVEDVVDEIVEIARLHGVSVLILEQRADLLEKYGEIAAVRYQWSDKTMGQESEREQEQNV
jgi:peptide subunit release factor 1 (eRF1)